MATPVRKTEFLDSDDHFINLIGIMFFFLVIVGVVLAYISSTTNVFNDSTLQLILLKTFLGIGALALIVIYSNFKALDILQDHALTLFKIMIYSFVTIISVIAFTFTGFLFYGVFSTYGTSEPIAFIIPVVALSFSIGLAVISFLISKYLIEHYFQLVAKWVKIGTTIVLNEKGMIGVAILQSIVSTIVGIVLALATIIYNKVDLTTGQKFSLFAVLVVFTYFSFVVLYYFDGANIFVAYRRVKNDDPTVRQGFRRAWVMLPAILLYSFFSFLVTLITRPYSWTRRAQTSMSRSSGYGEGIEIKSGKSSSDSIIVELIALALGVVFSGIFMALSYLYYYFSFFTLPSIVIRKKGAFKAMKESFKLFQKRPWDVIFTNFGIGWSNFIVYLFTAIISAVLGYIYGFFVFGPSWAVLFAVIALIFSVWVTRFVLRPLYMSMVTILYVEATEGVSGLKMVPDEMKAEIKRLQEKY